MGKLTLILLCGFVAFLPSEAMVWFEEVPSGSKLFGVFVVAAALVAFLAGHRFRLPSLPIMLRIVIVFLCAISYFWSVNREDSVFYMSCLAQVLVFFSLIWEFAVTYDDQLWIFRSYLVGMVVPALMALWAFRGATRVDIQSGERFSGGGQDLNYLAYMLSVGILIAIYMAGSSRPLDRFLRWVYWGFAAWFVLQTLLTGSRGGMLSLLATAVFAALMLGMKFRKIAFRTVIKIFLWFALMIGAAAPAAWWLVPQELLDRLTLRGGGGTSIEDDPRVRIWNRGIDAFWKRPIVGFGTGTFVTVTEDEHGIRRAPHNTFISYLVELGVVGLALYLVFLVLLFRAAWRLPHREKLLWLGILSISAVNCMTCGSQGDKFTWFLYAMVLVQEAALGPLNKRRARPALPRGVGSPVIAPLRGGLRRSR